jgi:hypothetical protein
VVWHQAAPAEFLLDAMPQGVHPGCGPPRAPALASAAVE